MAVIIELGSSTSAETPETVVGGNDCYSSTNDPAYNSEQHSLEKVRTVTGRPLQISTGRNLLHELFYLYAKMDVIQSLLRASPPLYLHPSIDLTIVSNYLNGDIHYEHLHPLFSVSTTLSSTSWPVSQYSSAARKSAS